MCAFFSTEHSMQAHVNIVQEYIIARLLHSDSGVVAPSVQPESLPSQSVTAESYIGINYIVEATSNRTHFVYHS